MAEEGRERVHEPGVGERLVAFDRHDLFDLVAGEQHPVAVEYLAARCRDINRLDPLALDRQGRQRRGFDALQVPEAPEKSGEQADDDDEHCGRPDAHRARFATGRAPSGSPDRLAHSVTVPVAWTRRRRRLRALGRRRVESSEKPPFIGGGRDEGGALGPFSAQPINIAAGSAKIAA